MEKVKVNVASLSEEVKQLRAKVNSFEESQTQLSQVGSILIEDPKLVESGYQLEIYREEYKSLREEIKQSIDKQHQILLAGYSASGLIIVNALGTGKNPITLFAVPIVLIAMTSLWNVELNRMVRASYYIAYKLWPRIEEIAQCKGDIGWETWIRDPEKYSPSRNIASHGKEFQVRQNKMQLIVSIWVPLICSVACVAYISNVPQVAVLYSLRILGLTVNVNFWHFLTIFAIFVWTMFFLDIRRVSNLATHTLEDPIKESN